MSSAKLFPFLAICVFHLLYMPFPQSLNCWRRPTNNCISPRSFSLLYLKTMSRSFLYCHKIAFSWCCFSFPSVLNLKLPTEKGGWCMFLFQTICLWWMSKVPALSAFIFNVWLSFVALVRSVYLLFNLVSQPEGCHGSIKCHHLSPRQVFPSAMVWLLTRFWQCLTSSALFATIGSHMHNGHI